jgi:hypothetical protein
MSNLSPIEALKRIEQFSDSGDYATAIVKMKAIATEALEDSSGKETGMWIKAGERNTPKKSGYIPIRVNGKYGVGQQRHYGDWSFHAKGLSESNYNKNNVEWLNESYKYNQDIDEEFRSIISHALLGSDINGVSKETWDLVISECVKYTNSLLQSVPPYKEEDRFEEGFELACQMLDDLGYTKTSSHEYNIADCLRAKRNKMPTNKMRKTQPYKEEVDKEWLPYKKEFGEYLEKYYPTAYKNFKELESKEEAGMKDQNKNL